jgi:hypothetical protein
MQHGRRIAEKPSEHVAPRCGADRSAAELDASLVDVARIAARYRAPVSLWPQRYHLRAVLRVRDFLGPLDENVQYGASGKHSAVEVQVKPLARTAQVDRLVGQVTEVKLHGRRGTSRTGSRHVALLRPNATYRSAKVWIDVGASVGGHNGASGGPDLDRWRWRLLVGATDRGYR